MRLAPQICTLRQRSADRPRRRGVNLTSTGSNARGGRDPPNRRVIDILRALHPLSARRRLAEDPVSAERNQRGADVHIADEVHEAHHTRPQARRAWGA